MKTFIVLLGLGGVILALSAFVWPAAFVRYLDLVPDGPQGISEIRAMYCGLLVGIGVWQIWASREPTNLRAALIGSGFIFGGLGVTRGLALLIGEFTAPQMAYTLFELTVCMLCILFCRRTQTS